MAESRDRILEALGETPSAGEAVARYARESEPITADDAGALPLDELLRLLAASHATRALAAALGRATPEDPARELKLGQRTTTVGARVFFLYFHKTYHAGQTELLRQLAGANDKVI